MTDLQHIPLHIRCTARYLIDPNYPNDDAVWWKAETQRSEAQRHKGVREREELSEDAKRMLAYLRQHGITPSSQIARDLQIATPKVTQLALNLTNASSIYESIKHGIVTYGVLDSVDKES